MERINDLGLPKHWLIAVDGGEASMKALMITLLELILPVRRDRLFILLMKYKQDNHEMEQLQSRVDKLIQTRRGLLMLDQGEDTGITYEILVGKAENKQGVSDKILEVAREKNVNNIILGTTGLFGVKQNKVGGVVARVLQNAPCVVSLVRSGLNSA